MRHLCFGCERLARHDCIVLLCSDVPDDGPWWKGRGDFEPSRPKAGVDGESSGEGEESGGEGEESSTQGSMDCVPDDDRMEKRVAQFTQYSMTSSVVPRSEGEKLLTKHQVGFRCYEEDRDC